MSEIVPFSKDQVFFLASLDYITPEILKNMLLSRIRPERILYTDDLVKLRHLSNSSTTQEFLHQQH